MAEAKPENIRTGIVGNKNRINIVTVTFQFVSSEQIFGTKES
jgi:hypothetical protein